MKLDIYFVLDQSPVSFRVIALKMENLEITPISTFNPISTKGEGDKIKHISRKVLQLALDVML